MLGLKFLPGATIYRFSSYKFSSKMLKTKAAELLNFKIN